MQRQPYDHERVFTDPHMITRYAKEQQRVFRFMHPPVVDGLRRNGFTKGRIIDVGCGPGYHAAGLRTAFPESTVIGIDLSEPLLDVARRHAAQAGIDAGLHFEKGDVLEMPYEDGAFDAAICLFMFHIVEHPIRMCDEIERVVKPGGQVVLIDLRRSRLLALVEREMLSCYTPAEAVASVASSTLRPLTLRTNPIWWVLIG